jgi:hypothetical protein
MEYADALGLPASGGQFVLVCSIVALFFVRLMKNERGTAVRAAEKACPDYTFFHHPAAC